MNSKKYRLGLVSVSFRGSSPEEILNAMKATKLTCIEWGSDIHAPCTDPEKLNEIAALQAEYGITCSSYGTYFRLGQTPIGELENYISAAKILGTNTLRLWCGSKRGDKMSESERTYLIDECRKAAMLAEAHGVTLCMECHKGTFTENPDDAIYLMNEISSPSFRMYWQPFQWQTPEQNISNAEKIAPYAEHIHVFNWRDDKKFPLADAVDEWREYLNQFSGPRTLLLEFMPNGSLGELSAEAEALENIIGERI